MKYFFHSSIILALVLIQSSVHAGQIKLYLDNAYRDYIMVEEQDCSIHKNKDGRITLGFKAGGLFWGIGPEIAFGKSEGIDWHVTIQGLIARYQELCARFNTGSLTKQEYENRLGEIESIERDAYNIYQNFIKSRAQKKQDMFDELDRETEKQSHLKNNYDEINPKLDLMGNLISIHADAITASQWISEKEANLPNRASSPQALVEPSQNIESANLMEPAGPIIEVEKPQEDEFFHKKLDIEILFKKNPLGDDIDIKTLKIIYLKLFDIDITDRILPYVTENKISASKVEFPEGNHQFEIRIQDKQKMASSKLLVINIQ